MRVRWKRPPAGRSLALAGTAALLASCAYNYAMAPLFECQLQQGGNCTDRGRSSPLATLYTRSIGVACFASAAVGWSRYRGAAAAYGARLRVHDTYAPTRDAAAAAEARGHAAFGAAVLAANALLIVPVDAFRLWSLAAKDWPAPALLYYKSARYAHNVVSCLWECRFVAMCYVLYAKFARLNRDMRAVGRRIVDPAAGHGDQGWRGNRFGRSRGDDPVPADRRPHGKTVNHRRQPRVGDDGTTADRGDPCRPDRVGDGSDNYDDFDDFDDFDDYKEDDDDDDDLWVAAYDDAGAYIYRSRSTGRLLADVVERLKIRHRLIREAADDLRYAFAIPMGASLCNLCVMALFDIYEHNQQSERSKRSVVFIAVWLTECTFRFFVIVATAHATTKQALRSKLIISFMIKKFLDSGTKEELQIFFSQISSSSLEFTIYDLFILKTQLFTSAIGACITYLVVILQMKSDYVTKEPST